MSPAEPPPDQPADPPPSDVPLSDPPLSDVPLSDVPPRPTPSGRQKPALRPGQLRRERPPQRARQPHRPAGESERQPGESSGASWNAMGTLLSGMAFWGLAGYGLDRLTGVGTVFFPIGILIGVGASLYLVIYQATRR